MYLSLILIFFKIRILFDIGDTGGPLMSFSYKRQQYKLVGITSYRDECKTEGIYTRIAPYINWILSIINKPPPTPPPPPTFPTLPPTRLTTMPPDVIGNL